MTNYLEMLLELGFDAAERGVWASVGRPQVEFGWKLHLASIQSEAPALISKVAPVLSRSGVPFKVALTDEMLGELNEGTFGVTQVGKFATIYPRDDGEAVLLARELTDLTESFSGPRIITDRRLGQVVYTRFGQFDARYERDRLGHMRPVGVPEGAEYSVPFRAPDSVPDPFADWPQARAAKEAGGPLIGPGFLLTRALSVHAKGSVSLAMDVRSPDELGIAVLKEGRRFCMSDKQGRHMWDRLRHQHDLGLALAERVRTPRPRALFEQGDSLFLALDHIEGRDISERPACPFGGLDEPARAAIIDDIAAIAETLGALHAAGIVHRDLSPRNVRIDEAGHAWLLDLEMADAAGERERLFMQGTAGFISPEQQRGEAASFTDDIYSLGCLIAFLVTGFDTRRMSLCDDGELAERIAVLSGAAHPLVDLCAAMLDSDPGARPALAEIASALSRMRAAPFVPGPGHKRPDTLPEGLLNQASRWLTAGGLRDAMTGMPLSPELLALGEDASLSAPQAYKLYRSANRGVGGVLYAVARLASLGIRDGQAIDFANRSADWLLSHANTDDDQMPGLHFGEAGVALALLEAVRAGLIDRGRWLRPYLSQTFAGEIDWPDLTHGAAGQGLAALQAAYLSDMPELADFADRCAEYLISTQKGDGGWQWPRGVEAMEGTAYTGFAHGTAGIAYFLAVHARLRADQASAASALLAGEWLIRQRKGRGRGDPAWWSQQAEGEGAWHWWCHGGPGIAITLLELHEMTGEARWSSLARAALSVHPLRIRHPNLSQCHGLAGLAEIYLEAARVLGEDSWRERAKEIGDTLAGLRRTQDGMASWIVENPYHATADLMIGSGGVAHLLARLYADDQNRLGMPLSIDPGIELPVADIRQDPTALQGEVICL